MVKAILHGCNGAMGHVISEMAEKDEQLQIVAGVDKNTEQHYGYPVYGSLKECREAADVILDFSVAKALDGLFDYCGETKIPVVLCFSMPPPR